MTALIQLRGEGVPESDNILTVLQRSCGYRARVTTELLLPYAGHLLFAVPCRSSWRQQGGIWRLPLLGICGGPGTSLAVDADVRLVDSRVSLHLSDCQPHRTLGLPPQLRPRPLYAYTDKSGCLGVTFQAELVNPQSAPVPGPELEALLGVYPSQVCSMLTGGADLERLLAAGAFLLGGQLPRPALVQPQGTPMHLPRYLEALADRPVQPWPQSGLYPAPVHTAS